MKHFFSLILFYFMRCAFWFRYRITVKGLDDLNPSTLSKPGGILFLPNHPTIFVDPTLAVITAGTKYPVRPLIVEYMYYMPFVHTIMRFLKALPVPNFVSTSNSLKKKKVDKAIDAIIDGLRQKDNFLIYPGGKVKHQAREIVSGSAVHKILQTYPDTNIVLVRMTGLWGSSFSRAITGKSPYMFQTIFKGIGKTFKNLLFFTPRRNVTIEFVPAPADFPFNGTRIEMNQYFENWYNRPDGLSQQTGDEPGETLSLVSYSMWNEELPTITYSKKEDEGFDLATIPIEIQEKVKRKLSEMTQMPVDKITPEMNLGTDMGLDSLENAELIAFLDDEYEVTGIPVGEMTTVGKVMALASKKIDLEDREEEEPSLDLSAWFKNIPDQSVTFPKGATVHEAFLNTCEKMKNAPACGDARAGVLTYSQAKLRVLLLADYIRTLPGSNIGILLPSSVAAYLTVLACQLAGKVPVMVNWTVGARHLESVLAISKIETVLSSWAFLDRLENVDLTGIEDMIVMLEDVARNHLGITKKLKAFFRSKLKTESILKIFGAQDMKGSDQAVLLFTSGTESTPKCVPLSHENVLKNQEACLKVIPFTTSDCLVGILPPFHSFGFTLSGLLPLISGFRVAYFPDPTDGKGVARAVEDWKATIMCGAPTFLKGMFKNGTSEQLKSLRIAFSGAEKIPADLLRMVNELDHCRMGEGYGITECSPVLTINMTGESDKGVGKAVPGTELCVVNLETHQPVPQGEQGLILARGPSVFAGYLNGPASPFVEVEGKSWYSTGDLGYLDAEGNLILSGRLKRFIKIGGEMVSLAAIEDALHKTIGKKIPSKDAEEGPSLAVCAKEEAGEKTKIFVFIRFLSNLEEVNKSLREAGFSNLVKVYKVEQVDDIPVMGSGKINYRALESKLNP